MREFGRYFKMSLDDDEEFLFDRVDVNANKIFNDIKLTFDDAVDLLNEKDKRIKRLENQLKHCEYLIIHFQQEKENLLSDIGDRINELNSLEEVNGLAVYELERILSAIKNEAYK